MATSGTTTDRRPEYCPACDRETEHAVSLRIVTESDSAVNAAFSREPYRVSECQTCGDRRVVRMNDA